VRPRFPGAYLSLFSPWEAVYLRRRPVVQPLPVAVDLHAHVLGVSHDCSLNATLHVVVVEGLGAGARGAILGSVGHALGRCVTLAIHMVGVAFIQRQPREIPRYPLVKRQPRLTFREIPRYPLV